MSLHAYHITREYEYESCLIFKWTKLYISHITILLSYSVILFAKLERMLYLLPR